MIKKGIENIRELRKKYIAAAKEAIKELYPKLKPIIKEALAIYVAGEMEKLSKKNV